MIQILSCGGESAKAHGQPHAPEMVGRVDNRVPASAAGLVKSISFPQIPSNRRPEPLIPVPQYAIQTRAGHKSTVHTNIQVVGYLRRVTISLISSCKNQPVCPILMFKLLSLTPPTPSSKPWRSRQLLGLFSVIQGCADGDFVGLHLVLAPRHTLDFKNRICVKRQWLVLLTQEHIETHRRHSQGAKRYSASPARLVCSTKLACLHR